MKTHQKLLVCCLLAACLLLAYCLWHFRHKACFPLKSAIRSHFMILIFSRLSFQHNLPSYSQTATHTSHFWHGKEGWKLWGDTWNWWRRPRPFQCPRKSCCLDDSHPSSVVDWLMASGLARPKIAVLCECMAHGEPPNIGHTQVKGIYIRRMGKDIYLIMLVFSLWGGRIRNL